MTCPRANGSLRSRDKEFPHARTVPAPAFPRRYDLDWLRIIAFGLLILYHTGMFYVTWDWHVKSVHAGPAAEWAMMLLNPWRLALLFFISGVALRFAADKLRRPKLSRERAVRLGLPILFGMIVIVAPQSWLQLVESGRVQSAASGSSGRNISISDPTFPSRPRPGTISGMSSTCLVYTLMLAPVAKPLAGS
jgi:glucan biosynthesis protein C